MPKGKKDLAKAIRQLRGDVSQQAFAHKLGIAVVSVSRYEHGASPDTSVLRKLYDCAVAVDKFEAAEILRNEIKERTGLATVEFSIPALGRLNDIGFKIQKELDNTFGTSEHEDRILSAVLQFLRDGKTSSREKQILEVLIGDHLNPKLDRKRPSTFLKK